MTFVRPLQGERYRGGRGVGGGGGVAADAVGLEEAAVGEVLGTALRGGGKRIFAVGRGVVEADGGAGAELVAGAAGWGVGCEGAG